MAGRPKGIEKTGGRTKGTPNRTTAEARELLQTILYGQLDNIENTLDNIKGKSDRDYIDALVKMFQYVLPKKTDVTSNDQEIKQPINIEVTDPRIGEALKKLLE